VFDDGRPRNGVAKRMHGFLTRDGTRPNDLYAMGREELRRYENVHFVRSHVAAVRGENGTFTLESDEGVSYCAQRVLLATGVYDALPDIEGLQDYWGRSAFVCPYCDGWEVRGKRLAVVGKGARAVELAQELQQWSDLMVVCLQGDDALSEEHVRWLKATAATVAQSPVRRLCGDGETLQALEFSDGSTEVCDALFLCAPLRPRYPLVDMLGCALRADGEIQIDERGRTTIAGVYAAGDAVTVVHQVVLAAASGVCAAMALNEDLLKEEIKAQVVRGTS
jgi:thioredoxin reductase